MGNACSSQARASDKAGAGTLILSDSSCWIRGAGEDPRMRALVDHLVWVVENDGGFAGKVFTADVRADERLVKLKKDLCRVHDKTFVAEAFEGLARAIKSKPEKKVRLSHNMTIRASNARAFFAAPNVALRAVDALLVPTNKQSRNALCLTRPSGHRATAVGGPKGFGLFNSAIVAAAYARAMYKLERIAIVDADPHEADGTQALAREHGFFFASTYLEKSASRARKRKLTKDSAVVRPLPWDCTKDEFRATWAKSILKPLDKFAPELIIFCFGFADSDTDPAAVGGAAAIDPDETYWLTRELVALAERHCLARLIALVEDGVHVDSVLDHTTMVLYAATGLPPPDAIVIVEEIVVEPEAEPEPESEPTPEPQPKVAKRRAPEAAALPPPPPLPAADDSEFIDPEHTFLDAEIAKQRRARVALRAQLDEMQRAADEGDAHERHVLARIEQLEHQLEAERDTLVPMEDALSPHVHAVQRHVDEIGGQVSRAQALQDAIGRNHMAAAKLREVIALAESRLGDQRHEVAAAAADAREREMSALAQSKAELTELKRANAAAQHELDQLAFASTVSAQHQSSVAAVLLQARRVLADIDDELLCVYDDVHAHAEYNDDTPAVRRMRARALAICKDSHCNLLAKKIATGSDAIATATKLTESALADAERADARAAAAAAATGGTTPGPKARGDAALGVRGSRAVDATVAEMSAHASVRGVDPAIVRLEAQVRAQRRQLTHDEAAMSGGASAVSPAARAQLAELEQLRAEIDSSTRSPDRPPRAGSVVTDFSPRVGSYDERYQ